MSKRTYEEETALIKELEAKPVPPFKTTEWHQYMTEISDAYWRRRMLSAKSGEISP